MAVTPVFTALYDFITFSVFCCVGFSRCGQPLQYGASGAVQLAFLVLIGCKGNSLSRYASDVDSSIVTDDIS